MGTQFHLHTKEESDTPDSRTSSTSTSNVADANNCISIVDYLKSSTKKEADKRVSRLLTMKKHKGFGDVFRGICCVESTFILKVSESSCPYQAFPRRVACALQELLPEEKAEYKTANNSALAMDETSEWCSSFMLVPKANGNIRLCLDPAWLHKVLIRPIHRVQLSPISYPEWQVLNTSHSSM